VPEPVTPETSPPATQPEVVATPPSEPSPAGKTFTAEDIARARQEEKDKLYGRLQKNDDAFKTMQDEIALLRQEREARIASEQARADAVAADAEAKRQEELSAKELLAEQNKAWESRFAQIQAEREHERALIAKEQEFLTLKNYARDRVTAEVAAETIAPELADLVNGNTKDEVEASIELIKAKTQAIAEGVRAAQIEGRQMQRGISPTGYSVTGPMDTETNYQSISPEQLKNMPMQKYAELRGRLGIGGDSRNTGLFG
jgi:hypothetical protein